MAVAQESSPIIVFGAPRSGTTYLTRILNEHPEISISHETRVFVWVHQSLNILTQSDEALLNHRERFVEHLGAFYPDLIRNFYRTLDPQARYWGDKNPLYASLPNRDCLNTISTLFPETRFIHIIRDGRDVVSSLIRKGWVSFDLAHDVWVNHVEVGRTFGEGKPPGKYYELRYEDLIRDDLGSARKLFEFLEIEIHDNVEQFCERQRNKRTPLSEPTRNINSNIAISEWNRTLTLSQRARSLELLQDHLIRYGYETDSTIVRVRRELTEQRKLTPIQRIGEAVRATVPYDATVIVASTGNEALLDLQGRNVKRYLLTQDDGRSERLFGEGAQGSVEAPKIEVGRAYEFRLYDGTKNRSLIAATTVTRSEEPLAQTADRAQEMLTAVPNPVPAGDGPGKTTISWSTGDGSNGLVYMAMDGGSERLFAEGTQGSVEAPWIEADKTYEFRLCKGTLGRRLATVTVTRTVESFLTATPNPVPAGDGPGKTTISWSTGDGSNGLVYVSDVSMDTALVPDDRKAALAHVEDLRAHEGEYLLFTSATFWWLERPGELQRHLQNNCSRIHSDENSIIYKLLPSRLSESE
jgi:hypothetical protein